MGFFSKIKKLWDVEDRLDDAVREYKEAQGYAEPAPAAPGAPEGPEAPEPVAAGPEGPEAPEPQPAAPAAPEARPAPEAAEPSAPTPSLEGAPESAPAPPTPPAAAQPAAPPSPPAAPTPPSAAPPVAPTAAPAAEAPGLEPWQRELVVELRAAEPRLSAWLGLILRGVDRAGPELWQRLGFLFRSLEVPEKEAEDFIGRFKRWLDDMEYERVSEFRSELQYRLALALDLEDEEDERSRLMLKLSEGLEKTRQTITRRIEGLLASHTAMDQAFWDELEEILIMADVGFEPTVKLVNNLKERVRLSGSDNPQVFKDLLRDELEDLFKTPKRISAVNPPEVIMMVGVNGVGKTTTIAKLAHRAQMQGRKVLIAAGDTFRAAAIEQLEIWAKRVGAGFYSKGENSDPAAVCFEAIDKAIAGGYDLVLLDTAGRLHTKVNLMEELSKISRVAGKKHPGAPHRKVLVVDATTGQNALSQTKLFDEAVGVDEIVLTKLDGTAKGGIVVAIALEFGIPITYVGLGEKMEDLRPFNGHDFAQALLT